MRFYNHPWHELKGLRRDLGVLFEDIFAKEPYDSDSKWKPLIDLIESDAEFIVATELPGMEKQDIKLNFYDNTLTLSGERKKIAEEKNYLRIESYYGPFKRSIKIPGDILQNKITANYQNGILLVHLPKKQDKKSEEMKIKID